MERTCLKVSGRIASRTTQVRPMIDGPQPRPTVLCQNLRIASLTSISGWKMLARTSMSVAGSVDLGTGPEEGLLLHRVEAAAAQRVAAKEPPRGEHEAAQDAEAAD